MKTCDLELAMIHARLVEIMRKWSRTNDKVGDQIESLSQLIKRFEIRPFDRLEMRHPVVAAVSQ